MYKECTTTGYLQKYQPSYGRSVSNIAENISASTRISNDILFGNIDAMGRAFERAQQHTQELARISVNNTKTIANTAKERQQSFQLIDKKKYTDRTVVKKTILGQ